jgi:uncharacterized repeat protein (TIGR03803 family)
MGKRLFAITFFNLLLMLNTSLEAQTFITLHNFTNTDGQFPIAGLVLASNVLYGTTSQGGSQSNGTVFAINIDGGNFRVLHSFTATDPVTGTNWDGAFPTASLVLSGGVLFGIATEGGTNTQGDFGDGTIFSVKADGTDFTVLHYFNGSDGFSPHARLFLSGSTLYGTTYWGGNTGENVGTIFSINTNGDDFQLIHAFAGYPEGANPEGGLIEISNVFYGTTEAGGNPGSGTVFSITTNEVFSDVLHNFHGTFNGIPTGTSPRSGLLYYDNQLFGTTSSGGQGGGIIFSLNTNGSGYSVLHYFTSTGLSFAGTNADGSLPHADLISCSGILYGTTYFGGNQGNGVVFAMNTDGSNYVVLHNFMETDPVTYVNADGANSESSLVIFNNTLYGTATSGGSQGNGTIFSLQLPSIAGIICNQDGSVTIRFVGGANTNLVQVSTTLSSSAFWQTISTNIAGTNGLWQFTDTNTSNYPFRFYRSVTQ